MYLGFSNDLSFRVNMYNKVPENPNCGTYNSNEEVQQQEYVHLVRSISLFGLDRIV